MHAFRVDLNLPLRLRRLPRLVFAALLATLAAGCNFDAEHPGVTSDIEEAATIIYPEVPGVDETVELSRQGQPLFRRFVCESCHSISDERSGLLGPPLGGIAERVLARHEHDDLEARRWLVMHIRDPQAYPSPYKQDPDYRGAHMPPNHRISNSDMKALVEYLWLLR